MSNGLRRFEKYVFQTFLSCSDNKQVICSRYPDLDFLEDIIRWRFNQMKANTYRLYNVSGSAIMTADPENIQAVLATKFVDYDLGPRRRDTFFEVLGDGIFTAERPAWAHYRAQLKPQFTRNQVSELDSAGKHLQVLFDALPETNEEGWVENVDMLPFLYRFTLDVSTEFLFGQSVNTQSEMLHGAGEKVAEGGKEEEEMSFSDAMNCVQEMISWRLRLNKLAYLMSQKKFYIACKVIKVGNVPNLLPLLSLGYLSDEQINKNRTTPISSSTSPSLPPSKLPSPVKTPNTSSSTISPRPSKTPSSSGTKSYRSSSRVGTPRPPCSDGPSLCSPDTRHHSPCSGQPCWSISAPRSTPGETTGAS